MKLNRARSASVGTGIEEQSIHPASARPFESGFSSRPRPDDQEGDFQKLFSSSLESPEVPGESVLLSRTLPRTKRHPGLERKHARGSVVDAVHVERAVAAGAVAAEEVGRLARAGQALPPSCGGE
jgi:hypothetical protein